MSSGACAIYVGQAGAISIHGANAGANPIQRNFAQPMSFTKYFPWVRANAGDVTAMNAGNM